MSKKECKHWPYTLGEVKILYKSQGSIKKVTLCMKCKKLTTTREIKESEYQHYVNPTGREEEYV